jgi:hypothetical protein
MARDSVRQPENPWAGGQHNIYSGYCGCLDYAANALCAHLLAAEQQYGGQYGQLFRWSSAALAPADADAVIPVQRTIHAARLPEGVQEPTARFDPEQLCSKLSCAMAATQKGSGSSCHVALTDKQKEAASKAAALSRLLQHLPDDKLDAYLPRLNQLHADVAADVPGFVKPQGQRSQQHWQRQDHHRKNRPLYRRQHKSKKNNSSSSSSSSQPAASKRLAAKKIIAKARGKGGEKFAKVKECGRPRTATRGRGHLNRAPHRGKGAGGLRPKRINPHKPGAAAQQQQRQQQAPQRSSKRRTTATQEPQQQSQQQPSQRSSRRRTASQQQQQ